MARIIVKKTFEITDAEWVQITLGFNEEFERDKEPWELKVFYSNTVLQYSYHGIAWEGDVLAGHTTFAPFYYKTLSGKKEMICLSGGSFVKKKYRADIFIFKDMYFEMRKAVKAEGVLAVVGVSNKKSFAYATKLLGNKFLYNLPYYILPVNLNAVIKNKALRFANVIYPFFLHLFIDVLRLAAVFLNPKEKKGFFTIEYPEDVFRLRFNSTYKTVNIDKFNFTYKSYLEKGINIAYIFEFAEDGNRTFRSLLACCRYIIKNEKIDIIAFVGVLKVRQPLLIKLPEKYEPQKLHLTINLLVDENYPFYKELQDAASWNFGLVNFDVR